MRDLVDIFGSSSDAAPQPDDLWDAVKPPGDVTSDPWDSVGVCCGPGPSLSGFSFLFIP